MDNFFYKQGVLFEDFDSYVVNRPIQNMQQQRGSENIRGLISPHIVNNVNGDSEGFCDMPISKAYTRKIPDVFHQFSDSSKIKDYLSGIHFFQSDERFNRVWTNPMSYIKRLRKFYCVVAPDFSLFLNKWQSCNIWNVFRNRALTCFWQAMGIHVIPSFSVGNADSLSYCTDGLPDNSTIFVGHVAVGKTKKVKMLFRRGIELLVERKRPTLLLVYGSPLDFDPGVPVRVFESRIQKLRKL